MNPADLDDDALAAHMTTLNDGQLSVLAEKFRRLLSGEVKGYASTAWEELARVASEHYEPICTACGDVATRHGCDNCEGPRCDCGDDCLGHSCTSDCTPDGAE